MLKTMFARRILPSGNCQQLTYPFAPFWKIASLAVVGLMSVLIMLTAGCAPAHQSVGSDGASVAGRPSLVGKKIAIIHYGIPPDAFGGVEENLRAHTIEFVRLGAEVVLIGSRGGGFTIENVDTYIEDYLYASKPQSVPPQSAVETTFRTHLRGVTHVIVHNVHSIPYPKNPSFVTGLHNVLRNALLQKPGYQDLASLERVVFMAHDMPSPDRPDLIERIGLEPARFPQNRPEVAEAFRDFVFPLWEYPGLTAEEQALLKTRSAYGTITAYQRSNVALAYGIAKNYPLTAADREAAVAEVTRIPSTGIYPDILQGPEGLTGGVVFPDPPSPALTPIDQILMRSGAEDADAVLFYATRTGVPRKRLELAVQSVAEALTQAGARRHPFQNIHLVITGPWDPHRLDHWNEVHSLRQQIRTLGAEAHVTILAVERAIDLYPGNTYHDRRQAFDAAIARIADPANSHAERMASMEQAASRLEPLDVGFDEVGAMFRYAGGMRIDSKPGFVFMTTEQEGAGMPVAEAIATGTHIVASPLGPLKETLDGLNYGYSFFPNVPPPRDAPQSDIDRFVAEVATTILNHLESYFGAPGSAGKRRTAQQLAEIEWFIDRFHWSNIIDRLWVPWLLGERQVVRLEDLNAADDAEGLFTGQHVWIGPPLATLSASIQQPEDVLYPYRRVLKTELDFDPARLKRVVLARHGETISNRWGVFQGSSDSATVSDELFAALAGEERQGIMFPYRPGETMYFDLNENGLRDAQVLAASVAQNVPRDEVSQIFSSPLRRAQQTAKALADQWSRSVAILDELKEASAPTWEGKHGDKQIKDADPAHALWSANPYLHAPPEGETATDLVRRVDSSLLAIDQATPAGQASIAFTHKGFLLWFLERYLGSTRGYSTADLATPNGQSAHWRIEVPNAAWAIIYLYDGHVVLPDTGAGTPLYPELRTPDPSPNEESGETL